jgi:hypothetical protein
VNYLIAGGADKLFQHGTDFEKLLSSTSIPRNKQKMISFLYFLEAYVGVIASEICMVTWTAETEAHGRIGVFVCRYPRILLGKTTSLGEVVAIQLLLSMLLWEVAPALNQDSVLQ